MKYPEKRENTLEYEVQITATDSEPQNNEDSRVVLHKDISLTDGQASEILRSSGLLTHRVSSKIDLSNVFWGKRKTRGVTTPSSSSGAVQESEGRVGSKGRTPRRKRGGDNCDESAATTTHESSAAEVSPKKAPNNSTKSVNQKLQRRLLQTTDNGEEVVASRVKRESKQIFSGISFVLTHSRDSELVMTEVEESFTESETETSAAAGQPRFDKRSLRSVIQSHGGSVLSSVPTAHTNNINTMDTSMLGVSDMFCRTMNYMLCLAHGVPLVSHVYILDCVQ